MVESTALEARESRALQPFRLVKYFSFTGLAMVLLSTFALAWLISDTTKNVLMKRSEAYALVISKNLNHQIMARFVLPIIIRGETIGLRNPSQYKLLDAIVRDSIHGLNVQAVTIYDSEQNIISYSTDVERIGRRGEGGVEYERALDGQENSTLIATGSVLSLLPGGGETFARLKTYIPFPFRPEKEAEQKVERLMGVIEIVQDLSGDMEAIVQLQATIIFTSCVVMGALFAALSFIVAKADRIIAERAEERRRFEERLNHAERLAGLGKMVASVSHEIKNPLGIVRSTAEILKKRLKSLAPGNEHLAEIIVEETGRLDGIVREFLDFARPQTPRLQVVGVNDILQKVMRFMDPEFEKHGVRLVMELYEALPSVLADQDLLYRAFLNIAINSLQAMPEGGALSVRTREGGGRSSGVVIEVADTGIGMSSEKQQQIFTPFFTDKLRGSGLGLAIVKNIIDGHQGEISVTSAEGEGTVFRIAL